MESNCGKCNKKLSFWKLSKVMECDGNCIEVCADCYEYLRAIREKSLSNEEKDEIQAIIQTDCDVSLKQYLVNILADSNQDIKLKQVNMDNVYRGENIENLSSIKYDIHIIKNVVVSLLVIQVVGVLLVLLGWI